MISVWSDGTRLPRFEQLQGDIKTDVLIIGGGMAGLLCARKLADSGVDYALVEAQTLCSGITKNTTAKITAQHGLIYDKLLKEFGSEKARMYLEVNQNALEEYRVLCGKIDCGFEEKDNFVYSVSEREKLDRELAALDTLGYSAKFVREPSLPLETVGAVGFERQAQFDPLRFAAAIAKDLNIYENTRVLELSERKAITDKGSVAAEKIIVATHFPFINKHGCYFLKQYQHRSYVLGLENAQQPDAMYVDQSHKGMSFRGYGELLLLGGGGHRTGKQGGGWRELEAFAQRSYPDARIKYRWATQDCMTLDGSAYIGQYSKNTPNLYVATGFNKWGMTLSMVAATLLTDMVLDRENPYAEAFLPWRTLLRPQLAVNAFEAVTSLLQISKKRCPHLGCALKWNAAEHSWDCPCHGSRFTQEGRLIDNPATGDLKSI